MYTTAHKDLPMNFCVIYLPTAGQKVTAAESNVTQFLFSLDYFPLNLCVFVVGVVGGGLEAYTHCWLIVADHHRHSHPIFPVANNVAVTIDVDVNGQYCLPVIVFPLFSFMLPFSSIN